MQTIDRFWGAMVATVASTPTFISISPSPVITATRASGADRASPRPIGTAAPMVPAMANRLAPSPVNPAVSRAEPASPEMNK